MVHASGAQRPEAWFSCALVAPNLPQYLGEVVEVGTSRARIAVHRPFDRQNVVIVGVVLRVELPLDHLELPRCGMLDLLAKLNDIVLL